MRKRVIAIASAGALALSACTGGNDPAEPRNDMGPAETQAAGEAITHGAHSDARDFRLAGDAGSAFGGCSSSFPANPADADGDNIPDELTVITYTSCVEGGFTFSGTQAIEDLDDANADFHFESLWDLDASGTSGGASVTYSYAGAIDATGGTSGTFTLSDASSLAATIEGDDFDGTIEDDHGWTVTFTPDDGVWTPAPGLPLEAGDLTLGGAWSATITEDGEGALVVEGVLSTSATLRTDPGCASSIVSGTLEVLVAEPEAGTLAVTWTGCGSTTATFTPLAGL